MLLLGGSPARLVQSFDVTAHSTRRDDTRVLQCVRAIKSALHQSLSKGFGEPAQVTSG